MKHSVSYYFLLIAIIFNVFTSTCFKLSSFKDVKFKVSIFFITGLLCGLISAYFYVKSLKVLSLNVVYPVFAAANMIIITILSFILFQENFTFIKSIGLLLIIGGIYLISKY